MKLPVTVYIGREASSRGKQWRFRVRFADGGKPLVKFYATAREARDMKAVIERLALTMPMAEIRRRLDDAQAARGQAPKVYPTLADAVAANLDRLEREAELRGATLYRYRSTQRLWVTPRIGSVTVDRVTRKLVGEVISAVKEAGKSNAIIDGVRHPIKATFARLIADGVLPAEFPNPGAELGEWIGKKRQQKQHEEVKHFEPETAIKLLERAADDYPRRYAFMATGMLGGLRWGESVALQADDIKWDEGVICVQRTWSEKARVVNPVKDSDNRRVPLTPTLRQALQRHQMLLDGEGYQGSEVTLVDHRGRRETRTVRLMFPNKAHRIDGSTGAFYELFWTKMQREAGLEPIKYHATRHTFASWALRTGEVDHKVQRYLGHATLQQTLGTYNHFLIGNRGELDGIERMLERRGKALPEKTE
jgi:integrase